MFKKIWCKLKRKFSRHSCMATVDVCLLTERKASKYCQDVYPASFDVAHIPDRCSFCQKEEELRVKA
jgi:hypothetical protein